MSKLLFIISLLFSVSAASQRLMPIVPNAQDSVINRYDSLGRETGLWVKFFYDDAVRRRIVNTGHYEAGKKVGVWRYYNNGGCFVLLDTSGSACTTEIFEADGSVTIIGLDTLHLNADSSRLSYRVPNRWREDCIKNARGGYDCVRVFDSGAQHAVKKTFEDIDAYLYSIGGKW